MRRAKRMLREDKALRPDKTQLLDASARDTPRRDQGIEADGEEIKPEVLPSAVADYAMLPRIRRRGEVDASNEVRSRRGGLAQAAE